MHKLYCPLEDVAGDKIIITEKDRIHHLKNVLRIKKGESIVVFDDIAGEYNCIVEQIDPSKMILSVKNKLLAVARKTINLTVACALPKKSKIDDIIDKLTQVGVDRVIPMLTERVIVKISKDKAEAKLRRWQKIADLARQQSQGKVKVEVSPVKHFKEVISGSGKYDLKIIFALSSERERLALKEILLSRKADNIILLIGPEGDFSPDEVNLALKQGYIPATLGVSILKVETAAVAAASFVRFFL